MESSDIVTLGLYMQAGCFRQERDFDEQSGIICKIPFIKAFDRYHRPIRSIVQAAQLVLFRFRGNHFHLLVKRRVLIDCHGNQAAFFFGNDADFR